MNDFLDTLQALIAANGLDPDTVTLAQLIALYSGPTTGSLYDTRGFSAPREDGCVRIRGIDELKAKLTDLGRKDVADLIPTWHITDYWNNNNSTSLQGINDLRISDYAKALLNRNMNRWFFIPGGVSGTPTIPTNWTYFQNGLQTPWGGTWTSHDAGRRAPYMAAFDVQLNPATPTRDADWSFFDPQGRQLPVIDDTYVWPMSVNCSNTDHHVGYFTAYARAVTFLDL